MARSAMGTNDFRGPAVGGPSWVSAITYRAALQLDVWQPAVANRPAIILLHGGAWAATPQTRANPARYNSIARMFAERGFAVVNADYTPANGSPQNAIDDGLALVQWVRDNAATYNIDSTRVAIVGLSSGGHLGFMAGITGVAGTTRPDAVVGWSPVTDLEASYAVVPASMERLLGVPLAGNEALYRSFSPVDQVTSNCCPLRIVGSDDEENGSDPGPQIEQYNDMETAAVAVGVSVTRRTFSGRLHAFFDGPAGVNDLPGAANWLSGLFDEHGLTLSRSTASGRSVATARTAA